jgi:CheY-like chemotaxis protein
MQINTDFQNHVRKALNHLYNPEQLRQSSLIQWFGLSERADAPSVLQHTLIDSIQALRPSQYESMYSEARKTYEILLLRYIQQFNQQEVAHHIGVSERQFRREQNRAIDILTESLWKKYNTPERQTPAVKPTPAQPGFSAPADEWNIDAEWGWIKKAYSERVTNTYPFIRGIIQLIESVASQHQVALEFKAHEHLPDLAVHPVALRQILLNLLRVAIDHASQGQIQIDVVLQESLLVLGVTAHLPANPMNHPLFDPGDNLLEIASRLTELSNGHLDIQEQVQGFQAKLLLPIVKGVSVLVVDDNRDIIELLQRYTTGTRYHLTGLEDPEQSFKAIETSGARMIILDVMMPKIDGWELLGRLRHHPLTSQIPVIILSILAQEELALSLGAKALVTKPITQERFLAVMDQVFAAQN